VAERFANFAQAALAADIGTSTLTFAVTVTGTGSFPSPPFRVRIDNELLLVDTVSGTSPDLTFTVPAGVGLGRGVESTPITAHSSGATVVQVLTALVMNALSPLIADQSANTVFAGPDSGADAAPAFRALVAADIPTLDGSSGYATGDILYASGAHSLSRLGIGSSGAVLTVSGGLPSWGSSGTVTSVSVTGNNGITASVTSPTTTPAITLGLGAITPSSVAATGSVTGSNLSGTNTGDQTITLTGDVTGAGTGSFTATIAGNAVTLAKMAAMATASFLGRNSAGTGNPEVLSEATAKSMLNLAGTNTGDVTLSGESYLSISGQAITAGAVDLSGTNATGTLAAARFPALTGDVTTSAGSLATAIGSGKVTNAMLAGSIAASKLVGTDIATVGTVTSGTWNAAVVGAAYGGTGVDGHLAGNGKLLIGNGSGYTLANLTAGAGVTVTNAAGGVTVAATVNPALCGGRLTLLSNTPVTTADQLAASNFYFTPYNGGAVAVYDGSNWQLCTLTQQTAAAPAYLFRLFDVFATNSGGTVAVETNAWDSGGQTTLTVTGATAASPCVLTASNSLSVGDLVGVAGIVGSLGTDSTQGINKRRYRVSARTSTTVTLEGSNTTGLTYTSGGTVYKIPTARTDDLAYQDGVLVKSSDHTRRYLGTIMTTGDSLCEDSAARRFVWNQAQRAARTLLRIESTSSWSYNTASYRQANGSWPNQVEVVVGQTGVRLRLDLNVNVNPPAVSGVDVRVGEDSTTSPLTTSVGGHVSSSGNSQTHLTLDYYPAAGYHFYAWLESGSGTGTTTWTGGGFSGMTGEIDG
jgi:hypothetical protein